MRRGANRRLEISIALRSERNEWNARLKGSRCGLEVGRGLKGGVGGLGQKDEGRGKGGLAEEKLGGSALTLGGG